MSKLELRYYQTDSVDASYSFLRDRDGNPIIVLPTGAGKSVVLGKIVADCVSLWKGRVLLLTHVKELIEQNASKIRTLCPDVKVGVYSAGLNRRDTTQDVICAGIQSVHSKACELGRFDLILVDECHLINDSDDTMYASFLAEALIVNPHLRVIGLTATPYRMKGGLIYGEGRFFSDVCYEIGVKQLIAEGYLSKLKTKSGTHLADYSAIRKAAGEFVLSEVDAALSAVMQDACQEVVDLTRDRKSVLVFAPSVSSGQAVTELLGRLSGECVEFIDGKTSSRQRDAIIARFRGESTGSLINDERVKYLVNCEVLTTGFDAPGVDCVVLLRPTMSPGLYYQMVGRGFRVAEGKADCLVLDYGGNVIRHGPVDAIQIEAKGKSKPGEAPAKECPTCHALIACGYARCPECGHEFPPPESTEITREAETGGIISGQVLDEEYEVRDVSYSVHEKRGATEDDPRTLRVDYRLGLDYWVSEWICFEHTGWARQKAERWWRLRSPDPPPCNSQEARDLAVNGALALTEFVKVRSTAGERFDRIIDYKLGPKPEPGAAWSDPFDEDDVPF